MPGYWINGGALAGTLNYYCMVNIWDEDKSLLSNVSIRFDYQRRNAGTITDQNNFFSGWGWPGGVTIDQAGSAGTALILGQGIFDKTPDWEPWRLGWKGNVSPLYIRGTLTDINSVPIAGATVDSFLTSNDVKDGTTVSGPDGSYAVPCFTRTGAHYVTAYLSGAPDVAGTSVNTLIPGA